MTGPGGIRPGFLLDGFQIEARQAHALSLALASVPLPAGSGLLLTVFGVLAVKRCKKSA